MKTDKELLEEWEREKGIDDEEYVYDRSDYLKLMARARAEERKVWCNGCSCTSEAERAVADEEIYRQGYEKGKAEERKKHTNIETVLQCNSTNTKPKITREQVEER